jgi:small basic protein
MLTFHLDLLTILTLVVGIILPLVVGLVTKVVTSPNVKAIILALLTVVIAFGNELIAALTSHETYDVGAALVKFVGLFLIAVGFHFGLWKPTGVATKAQAVGSSQQVATDTPADIPPAAPGADL